MAHGDIGQATRRPPLTGAFMAIEGTRAGTDDLACSRLFGMPSRQAGCGLWHRVARDLTGRRAPLCPVRS